MTPLTLLLPLAILMTPSAPPAPPAPARQFDFWLGSWEVQDRDGKLLGHSRIESVQKGLALQEHWEGAGGGAGTSLNGYWPALKAWRQIWMGSDGTFLDLQGGLEGQSMVLRGASSTARGPSQERITWTPLPDGRVRQFWEQSLDGGATWAPLFEGFYRHPRRP